MITLTRKDVSSLTIASTNKIALNIRILQNCIDSLTISTCSSTAETEYCPSFSWNAEKTNNAINLGYKITLYEVTSIKVECRFTETCRTEIFQSTKLSSGICWDNSSLTMAEFEAAAKLNHDSSTAGGRLVLSSCFFFSFQ